MSRESKMKKSSSDCLNSGNALIQWVKNVTFVFPVLPGSAEAQVIWGDIVKNLWISYFIGSIYVKKCPNPFTCVKVIASQRWDAWRFLRHGVYLACRWTFVKYRSNELNVSAQQLISVQQKYRHRRSILQSVAQCLLTSNQHDIESFFLYRIYLSQCSESFL